MLCYDLDTGDIAWVCLGDSLPSDGTQSTLFLDSHVGFEKRAYCGTENDNIYSAEDGQNVLMDSHVGFEKEPYVGINDDNIYTY